jgi:carbon-monoxide dehydrogenase large subunit
VKWTCERRETFPAAAVRGRTVLSNTSPLSAYRSAGRPQVMFVMERLIDLTAHRHGFDRVELRRRNLVPTAAMPYTNPCGIVYDSGDYGGCPGRRGGARRLGRASRRGAGRPASAKRRC